MSRLRDAHADLACMCQTLPCLEGCRLDHGLWPFQKQPAGLGHENGPSCEEPRTADLQQGMEQAGKRQVHEDHIERALSVALVLKALRVLQVQRAAPVRRRLAQALPPRCLRAPAAALLRPVATCAQISRPLSTSHWQ